MLLLDTHAWLWATDGAPRLGRKASRLIDRAAAAGRLRLSVVSVFEVAALCAKRRVTVRPTVEEWIAAALDTDGLRVAEVTAAIALDAGRIPPSDLADPMDRIIAATARRLDASVVTADRALLLFAEANDLKFVDASR